ncbi:hypothetical protein HAX54_050023 [Datura stramonium]|uniref:Uncharacterized protein n=1 Tax=Datura stramonium TaxID=4076 RepID=A0ABS8WKZ1_DATST|nr:hypothetical protein [Datura stramonium]
MHYLELEEASGEGIMFCGIIEVVFIDEDEVRLKAEGKCEAVLVATIKEEDEEWRSWKILSIGDIARAYSEWLLPLRTLVTGVVAENQQDHDQLASDTICALNPIELVLYRCIELVEDNLKNA